MSLAVHRGGQLVEQAGKIFVHRHQAHVVCAIQASVNEANGGNACLDLAQRFLCRCIVGGVRLQLHHRGDHLQAVGNAMIDFRQQQPGAIARAGELGRAFYDPRFEADVQPTDLIARGGNLASILRLPSPQRRRPRG
jgi:hypothetical protein